VEEIEDGLKKFEQQEKVDMDEFYQLKEVSTHRHRIRSIAPCFERCVLITIILVIFFFFFVQELDDNLKRILKQILNIVEPGAADTKIVSALKTSLECLPVGALCSPPYMSPREMSEPDKCSWLVGWLAVNVA
jgi:hypothetical protein